MARRVMIPVRCGLIQIVHIEWDKSARGGEGARERTAVPQAFDVDPAQFVDATGQLCIETTDWGNRNGFAEPISSRQQRCSVGDGFTYGCVNVAAQAEGLQALFLYSSAKGGAPDRWYFNLALGYGNPSDQGLLARAGDWVRVCYNGRFSEMYEGNWLYQQITVNVAWFDNEPNGRIFLDQKPAHELRALGNLW